ncbi:hypothetical protein [Streptomyces kanasensis]|uniref:hypothetical protein n=1 Tax=Streptomyces kanasensis TaxID=936756 RepID=UPI003823DFE7
MNLRVIGLGAVVVAATLLPLVATAGPAGGPREAGLVTGGGAGAVAVAPPSGALPAHVPADARPVPGTAADARPATGTGTGASVGAPDGAGSDGAAPDASGGSGRKGTPARRMTETDDPSEAAGAGRVTRCGPALVSPQGVDAQTCVVADGAATWARTYYRNTGGEELRAILSLMGPAGRTVRTHCVVPAVDEPGTCETPREGGRGGVEEYTAVAEFAAGGDPESPLLLRSGSVRAPSPAG